MSSSHVQWHSVNPVTRPLTLSILELTPLALTLSLTLAAQASSSVPLTPKRKKQRHRSASSSAAAAASTATGESDEDLTAVEGEDDPSSPSFVPGAYPVTDSRRTFKDLLSHGVVVSVNGQPWSRIVAHVSDPTDSDDAEGAEDEGSGAGASGETGHAGVGGEEEWDEVEPGGGTDGSVDGDGGEDGLSGSSGMTRRRPRKARFGLSATRALGGGGGGAQGTRRKSNKVRTEGAGNHMKQDRDRAVVVVYGLTPGKEYEIDLRVVGAAGESEASLSNSVLIPQSPSNGNLHPRSRANSLRSRSNPRSRSNSVNTAQQNIDQPSLHPVANGLAEPPVPIPIAVATPVLSPNDAQAAQLRHLIAASHVEKEHLQAQIKEARRSSQRAEAQLRVEIDNIKKAIDKAGTLDMRAKQKALALQEQVKQGWAGAENADKETTTVDGSMPDLELKLESIRVEVEAVRGEWKIVKDKEEEVKDREKRARAEEDKKLAEVQARVDKMRARKDRKDAERAELERRLEELEKQRGEAERRHEEDRSMRRNSGFWHRGWEHEASSQTQGHLAAYGGDRGLTNHPSLNNLGANAGFAGPAFRPRSGQQPGYGAYAGAARFPSAGAGAPQVPARNVSAPSPTLMSSGFNALPPPSSQTSFRPPGPSPSPGPNSTGILGPSPGPAGAGGAGGRSMAGVNVSAMPFHPINFSPGPPPPASVAAGSTANTFDSPNANHQMTSLMPPQLQHRIYPPSVRPRNFHASSPAVSIPGLGQGSMGAPASGTGSPAVLSAPSFPPLPGSTGGAAAKQSPPSAGVSGPSLASIVTRAVLNPNSALAQSQGSQQAQIPIVQSAAAHSQHSPPAPAPSRSWPVSATSPVSPHANYPSAPVSAAGGQGSGRTSVSPPPGASSAVAGFGAGAPKGSGTSPRPDEGLGNRNSWGLAPGQGRTDAPGHGQYGYGGWRTDSPVPFGLGAVVGSQQEAGGAPRRGSGGA